MRAAWPPRYRLQLLASPGSVRIRGGWPNVPFEHQRSELQQQTNLGERDRREHRQDSGYRRHQTLGVSRIPGNGHLLLGGDQHITDSPPPPADRFSPPTRVCIPPQAAGTLRRLLTSCTDHEANLADHGWIAAATYGAGIIPRIDTRCRPCIRPDEEASDATGSDQSREDGALFSHVLPSSPSRRQQQRRPVCNPERQPLSGQWQHARDRRPRGQTQQIKTPGS